MKTTVRILLVALLFTLPTPVYGATNKAGGSCSKIGNETSIAKEKYSCQLVKKKFCGLSFENQNN